MNKIVAIHQPNFFPWLGFFDKIIRSDAFILLDQVQFPKTGGIWTNRVKLLIAGEARWVTAPIVRDYHGVRSINEMEFLSKVPWRERILKTICMNYSKAPCFQETMPFLEPLITNPVNNISAYNTRAILAIAAQLGIEEGKFFLSSKLAHEGTSNELLISLTIALKGDTYMCGGGSDGYQNEYAFEQRGLTVLDQQYNHPEYQQVSALTFTPGLSVIDAFMNLGLSGVEALVNREPNASL